MTILKKLLRLLDSLLSVATALLILGVGLGYWFGNIVITKIPGIDTYLIHFNR